MDVLAPHWLAEMHREVYVAILQSWVPHGHRGELARQAGITREYLSYLCALDRRGDKSPTRRLPSPVVTQRLAEVLPAPPQVRQNLIEHMTLSHLHAAQGRASLNQLLAEHEVEQLIAALGRQHRQATFSAADSVTGIRQRAYRVLLEASTTLLAGLSPNVYPAAFVQTCLYLHDALCVLDQAEEALYYGKLAHLVMESTEAFERGWTRTQIDDLRINAVRARLWLITIWVSVERSSPCV